MRVGVVRQYFMVTFLVGSAVVVEDIGEGIQQSDEER